KERRQALFFYPKNPFQRTDVAHTCLFFFFNQAIRLHHPSIKSCFLRRTAITIALLVIPYKILPLFI
ncbi:MAG: hypothetical protein ACRC91_22880, partial [Aeromonas sp.]